MAQSFITTYRNDYRWQSYQKTPLYKVDDVFGKFPLPEELWIKDEIDLEELDPETADERIRQWYLKRMWSTYQRTYCRELVAKALGKTDVKIAENELLEYCKNLYEPESLPKILPPLPSNRKVFGYLRPTKMYTPLTTYQHTYGRIAYDILKKQKSQSAVITPTLHVVEIPKKKSKFDAMCNCTC